VLLTLTLPRPAAAPDGETIRAAIRDGVRFVRDDAGLRVSVAAMCLNTFLAAPFIALVPAMAIKVLGEGDGGVSVLVTAQGIGAVAMGVSLGSLTARIGSRRVLVGMLTWLPAALALYAYAPNLPLASLALVAVGALYLGAFSTFTTIAQLRAPASLRGRVLSVNMVVLGTLYPLGSVLQGWLGDRVGLRETTALAAACMAAVVLGVRALRPRLTEALDPPVAVPVGHR
jgi:predicted MFS family arabinose efflux permease